MRGHEALAQTKLSFVHASAKRPQFPTQSLECSKQLDEQALQQEQPGPCPQPEAEEPKWGAEVLVVG